MRTRPAARGFALPMVLLVMFVLVGAIAAGFAMLSSERMADDAAIQSQGAAALAETGLAWGLRSRTAMGLPALPPVAGDQHTLDFGDTGKAIITTYVLRDTSFANGKTGLYFVQSRGETKRGSLPGGGVAVAVVGAFATFIPMQTNISAAFASLNGISLGSSGGNSGNGTIDGSNSSGCGGGALPAIGAPNGSVVMGKGFKESSLIGTPKLLYQGSTAEAVNANRVNWSEIVRADGPIPADYSVRANFGSPSPWPRQAAFDSVPTIRVLNRGQRALNLPEGSGKGLLIVAGDLDIGGGTNWEGIVLVGGRLKFSGGRNAQITGAVVTGLNYETLDPGALPRGDFRSDDSEFNGAVNITYNSCAVINSLVRFGSLRVVGRTWVNTLPSY